MSICLHVLLRNHNILINCSIVFLVEIKWGILKEGEIGAVDYASFQSILQTKILFDMGSSLPFP